MCGRTVCHLAPDDLRRACKFKDKQGRSHKPDWRDAPSGRSYFPSYNIAPGAHTPVLLSSQHFPGEHSCDRVIQPMLWGLVPSWHKGAMSDKAYETNNCRAESMLEKATYKVPLQKGRRCVILAEGFYEWKRDNKQKQPYYIYFPQPDTTAKHIPKEKDPVTSKAEMKQEPMLPNTVKQEPGNDDDGDNDDGRREGHKVEDICGKVKIEPKEENDNYDGKGFNDDDDDDATSPRLLTMAGVFDVWNPLGGGEPVYSYSVITVESSPAVSWIHHRMPAMLTNDEEIDQWINFGEVPLNKASSLIRAVTCLESHPVSTVVNNSRNKTPECVKKVDLSKPKTTASSMFMSAWLLKSQKVKKEEPPNKKPRLG